MNRAFELIRNICLGRTLAFAALVALGTAALPVPAPAQVVAHYGEGAFGRYRDQLAGYFVRESDIESELGDLYISDTYCVGERPSLQDAIDQLNAIEARYNALMAEYAQFKDGMNGLASHPQMLTGFPMGERVPGDPNFWSAADRSMNGARAIIAQKRAQIAKAHTVDCTPPQPQISAPPPPEGPPPPPVWPPVAPSQPLAGSTRPPIDTVPVPTLPDHFCTEDEKRAYQQNVFDPLYQRAYRAAHDATGYRADISHVHLRLVQQIYELQYESKPGTLNPNLLADLQRQAALVQAEIDAWEPIAQAEMATFYKFTELANALLNIPVIDCTPKETPPPPNSPPPTVPGTGMSAPLPLSKPYPHVPDRFCSQAEKDDLLKILAPLLEQAQSQAAQWAAWAQLTHDPNDANIAQTAAQYATALQELVEQVEKAKVKDCENHEHASSGSFFNNVDIGIGIGVGGGHDDHGDHEHGDHSHGDSHDDSHDEDHHTTDHSGW